MYTNSTMMKVIATLLVAFVVSITTTNAQIEYLPVESITPAWTGSAGRVAYENGVFLSPDGALAVVIGRDATVTAFDADSGIVLWSYPAPSATAVSPGGVFFCYSTTVPYLVYSVSDFGVDSSFTSTLVALNPSDGSEILTTGAFPGLVVGTPVTTEDGQYILVNANVNATGGSTGTFYIHDIASPSAPIFTYTHPVINNEPFGALGYYYNPLEGNFAGGEFNTNDVFIWSFDTNIAAGNVSVGTSQFFGFQFPTTPGATLNVTLINGDRDYQARKAPVITDNGLSMYWSVSRSKTYGWVGTGEARSDFSTNGVGNFGTTRDSTAPWASAYTTPTLSNSSTDGFVVGTGAIGEIWRSDRNFTAAPIVVTTPSVIFTRLLVSPDDAFIYYATLDGDNSLYQVSSTDLSVSWRLPLAAPVLGEIAQTLNGARIIVADSAGVVTAFNVATAPDVTVAPATAVPIAPTVPIAPSPVVGTTGPVSGSPPPAATPTDGTTSPSVTMAPTGTLVPSNSKVPSSGGTDMPALAPTVPGAPVAPSAPVMRPPTTPTAPVSTSDAVSAFISNTLMTFFAATMTYMLMA